MNGILLLTIPRKGFVAAAAAKKLTGLTVSYLLQTESVVQRYSVRKMFLEISQNS